MGPGTKHARVTRLIIDRKLRGDFFVVKTTANVRQIAATFTLKRPRERPKNRGLLEVFFFEQEMNFRTVNKTWEFMVKSRTTSDEIKKSILEKKKDCPRTRFPRALYYI